MAYIGYKVFYYVYVLFDVVGKTDSELPLQIQDLWHFLPTMELRQAIAKVMWLNSTKCLPIPTTMGTSRTTKSLESLRHHLQELIYLQSQFSVLIIMITMALM